MFVDIKEFIDDDDHILIVDTEFLEIANMPTEDTVDGGEFFVDVYKRRGLNVAANLALLVRWGVEKGYANNLEDSIAKIPAHKPYKNEVLKYLMLV
jgi:hypothetical protein